jgi:hypothetical protein
MAKTPPTPTTFYDHFAANMEALGLEAPESLFDSAEKATLAIGAIATAIKEQRGKPITMRALARSVPALSRASTAAAFAVRAGAVYSAFYAGACIGSFAVAVGKTPSMRDFVVTANQLRVQPAPWLMPALAAVAAQVHARHIDGPPR